VPFSFLGIFVFKRVAVMQLSCWLLVSILPALPELLQKRLQTATVNEMASEQVLLAKGCSRHFHFFLTISPTTNTATPGDESI